eukprot:TRINITY_DN446_c0_g2_i1.p1 TRINITY_DN446_c0_g2~~TRINITY_DN446_c0_g2_i1.p1  ORF type:complete len:1262 (-),score=528.17 TRINITY_DN446_c0_g2_i1:893-4678(-)
MSEESWQRLFEGKSADFEDLEKEFQEFTESSAELEKELESELQAKDDKINQLTIQLQKARQTPVSADNSKSLAEISDLQQQLGNIKRDLEQSQSRVRTLELQNDEYEQAKRASDARIDDLTHKYEKSIEETVLLSTDIEDLKAKHKNELSDALESSELVSKNEKLSAQVAKLERDLEEIKESDNSASNEDKSGIIEDLNQQIEDLSSAIDSLEVKNVELTDKLNTNEEEFASKMEGVERENGELATLIEEEREANEALSQEMTELTDQLIEKEEGIVSSSSDMDIVELEKANTQLTKDKEDLEAMLSEARSESKSVKDKAKKMKHRLKEAEDIVEKVEKQLEILNAQQEAELLAKSQAEAEMENLVERKKIIEEELLKQQQLLEEQKNELLKKKEEEEEKNLESNVTDKESSEQVATLLQDKKDLQEQLTKKDTEISGLSEKFEKEKEALLLKWKIESGSNEDNEEDGSGKMSQLHAKLASVQAELSNEKKENDKMAESILTSSEEVNTTVADNKKLKVKLNKHAQALKHLKKRNRQYKARLQELGDELGQHGEAGEGGVSPEKLERHSSYMSLDGDMAPLHLDKSSSSFSLENSALKEQVNELREKSNALSLTVTSLKQTLETEKQSFEVQESGLKSDLEGLQRKHNVLVEELNNSKMSNDSLTTNLSATMEKLESIQNECIQLKADNDEMVKKFSEISSEYQRVQATSDENRELMSSLHARIKELESEAEGMIHEDITKTSQLSEAREKIRSLETDAITVDTVKHKQSQLQRHLDSAITILRRNKEHYNTINTMQKELTTKDLMAIIQRCNDFTLPDLNGHNEGPNVTKFTNACDHSLKISNDLKNVLQKLQSQHAVISKRQEQLADTLDEAMQFAEKGETRAQRLRDEGVKVVGVGSTVRSMEWEDRLNEFQEGVVSDLNSLSERINHSAVVATSIHGQEEKCIERLRSARSMDWTSSVANEIGISEVSEISPELSYSSGAESNTSALESPSLQAQSVNTPVPPSRDQELEKITLKSDEDSLKTAKENDDDKDESSISTVKDDFYAQETKSKSPLTSPSTAATTIKKISPINSPSFGDEFSELVDEEIVSETEDVVEEIHDRETIDKFQKFSKTINTSPVKSPNGQENLPKSPSVSQLVKNFEKASISPKKPASPTLRSPRHTGGGIPSYARSTSSSSNRRSPRPGVRQRSQTQMSTPGLKRPASSNINSARKESDLSRLQRSTGNGRRVPGSATTNRTKSTFGSSSSSSSSTWPSPT